MHLDDQICALGPQILQGLGKLCGPAAVRIGSCHGGKPGLQCRHILCESAVLRLQGVPLRAQFRFKGARVELRGPDRLFRRNVLRRDPPEPTPNVRVLKLFGLRGFNGGRAQGLPQKRKGDDAGSGQNKHRDAKFRGKGPAPLWLEDKVFLGVFFVHLRTPMRATPRAWFRWL